MGLEHERHAQHWTGARNTAGNVRHHPVEHKQPIGLRINTTYNLVFLAIENDRLATPVRRPTRVWVIDRRITMRVDAIGVQRALAAIRIGVGIAAHDRVAFQDPFGEMLPEFK